MARTRMGPVDTTWYRIDAPDNPVDVAAVLLFREPLGYDDLRRLVAERLLRFDRFRQRIVESRLTLLPPRLEEDRALSVDDHLLHVALPAGDPGGDAAALQRLVGDLVSQPLDLHRPPWQLTLIDGVDGGSALLARLHHCLGDGFALAHALLSIADDGPPARPPRPRAGIGRRMAALLRHPVAAARGAAGLAASLGHLITLSYDPPTALRIPVSGVRRVAWSEPLALDEVKAIAHSHGATLNDILVCAAAGAIGRFLGERGDGGRDVRAMIPVNLRPARFIEEMDDRLGNRFGLVFLDLALTAPTPAARLEALQVGMGRIKGSAEAAAAFGVLAALGRVPAPVEWAVGQLFARKGSVVMTNVPGPRARLRLAGRELTGLMFWVPHPVELGLGVSLISYAGEVRVGVRADAAVCDRPEVLVGWFGEELDRLR